MSHRLCALFLVFLLHLAASAPPTLVPQIRTPGFQLEPFGNKYFLSIQLPDGTTHHETVMEIAPGQLQVRGVIDQPFLEKGTSLFVTYQADANGYVAKYTYGKVKPTPPTAHHPPPPTSLSSDVLKSSIG